MRPRPRSSCAALQLPARHRLPPPPPACPMLHRTTLRPLACCYWLVPILLQLHHPAGCSRAALGISTHPLPPISTHTTPTPTSCPYSQAGGWGLRPAAGGVCGA